MTKTREDDLSKLIEAVAHLRRTVLELGPSFKLTSIVIDDGNKGHLFDKVMKAAPSYVMRDDHSRPSASTIMDVKIEIVHR